MNKLPNPVGVLRSDEFAGHIFEPHADAWTFNESLFTESQLKEFAKKVPLTEDQVFDSDEMMELNGMLLRLKLSEIMKVVRAVERLHGIGEE